MMRPNDLQQFYIALITRKVSKSPEFLDLLNFHKSNGNWPSEK